MKTSREKAILALKKALKKKGCADAEIEEDRRLDLYRMMPIVLLSAQAGDETLCVSYRDDKNMGGEIENFPTLESGKSEDLSWVALSLFVVGLFLGCCVVVTLLRLL